MQCEKCGTVIKEGCLFCHNCGEAVQMVPDYEPEIDDLLQVRIARAQTKLPNKPTVKQIEEKTEEGIRALKTVKWKPIFIVSLLLIGLLAFIIAYGSVLSSQEPGAMQQNEPPEVKEEYVYIPMPRFNWMSGTYSFYISVELECDVEGKIYYTLDGSTPNELSYIYKEPINLPEGTTIIRAFVVDQDGNSSDIASQVYEIEFGAPDKPTIFPESGDYEGEQYVRFLVPEHCVVYYTLDGSEPTSASEIYTGEFLMPEGTTTVAAIIIDENGLSSEVSYVTYNCTRDYEEETYEN